MHLETRLGRDVPTGNRQEMLLSWPPLLTERGHGS